MIEFGETLRKKRVEKGLTVSDIANTTHMLVQQVEALEKEDFSKIAAPIYGRGFVKLYCEAVGIEDPKPYIDEFMDIFSGNRPPTIRMRETTPSVDVDDSSPQTKLESDEPSLQNQADELGAITSLNAENIIDSTTLNEETSVQEPPPARDLFDFSLESETVLPKSTTRETPLPSTKDTDIDTIEATPSPIFKRSQGPSRYAAPQPLKYEEKSPFVIPPVFLRIGVLVLGAALLIWLIFSGISCLYSASMTTTSKTDEKTVAETPSAENQQSADSSAKATPKKRTPMKLPPLYID